MKKVDIELLEVDQKECYPNDWNPNKMLPIQMAGLEKSMLQYPYLMQAERIIVWRNETDKGKYEIMDGEHRWSIATKNTSMFKTIPIAIVPVKDKAEAKLISLALLNKGEVDYVKKIKLIDVLLKESDSSDSFLDTIGEDKSNIYNMLESLNVSSNEELLGNIKSDIGIDSMMDDLDKTQEVNTDFPHELIVPLRGVVKQAYLIGLKHNYKDVQTIIRRACKIFIEKEGV